MDNQKTGPNPAERPVAKPDQFPRASERQIVTPNEKPPEIIPAAKESAPSRVASSPAPPVVQQPQAPVVSQPAQPPAQANPIAQAGVSVDPASLPAEDSDLIEKEWVDTVDKVIEHTKDDPYTEEEAQQNLSRTYLKKRFKVDVD